MKFVAIIGLVGAFALAVTGTVSATDTVYDRDPINGHAGFLSAWRVSGKLDKPVIVAKGYDTVNNQHPIDYLQRELGTISQQLVDLGHDVIVFDYVNGEADLKDNADNLAQFIRYLDGLIAAGGVIDRDGDGHPDYELAIIGGSMGGIVARTMFVQENDAMGVDTFVTVDSPHHGVQLSPYLDWATAFLDSEAGRQMLFGTSAHSRHYDWLRSVERAPEFMARVIDPMHTAAIALSNGETAWHLDSGNLLFHTDFHDVSSFIEQEGVESDYVPYHSAVNMDNTDTNVIDRGWDSKDLEYEDTKTTYFDRKIPNLRDLHEESDKIVQQAIDFVIEHSEQQQRTNQALIPILDLLLQ